MAPSTHPHFNAENEEQTGPSEPQLWSDATAEALEFSSLRALLMHRTASDLGHQCWSERFPCATVEELEQRRGRFKEAERLVAAHSLVPSIEHPLRPLFAALDGGAYELTGIDLVRIGDLLEVTTEAHQRIAQADPECTYLAELVDELPTLAELRQTLRQTFDPRGEIREDATPKLASLRKRIRQSRQHAYQQLGQQVERFRDHLSEETIPMRDGRLVLMLQSGARGKVPGLVHGRSGSGKSFYFEPLDAVEINNDLQQAMDEESIEKRRILNDLILWMRRETEALNHHRRCFAELDALQASVRFGQICGGRLADLGERHELILKQARHPLLDPSLQILREDALGQPGHTGEIIPLDLELSMDKRALVVTGPNAGGKTVALKTTGLLAMMHQFGLPVPVAKGSRLPFSSRVVATVGDDQDLLADRSTFSGRLLRLREAWLHADEDALILLDELGSGTDPEEGAALSIALLEGLLARRCLMLVTTHLSQVAAAALEGEGSFCASMQFDTASGQPTYRLLPGPPGGSEALALARRLGLPSAWLDRAEALLGSEHRDLRRLLAEIEETRNELAQTQKQLEIELADAEILRKRLAERESALATEQKTLGRRLEAELRTFRDTTQRQLSKEIDRLRQKVEQSKDKGLVQRKGLAQKTVAKLFEEAPVFEEPVPELEGPIAVGMQVRHRRMGWQGLLEQLDRGRCQVRVKGKLLRCKADELAPLGSAGSAAKTSKQQATLSRTAPVQTAKAQPMREHEVPRELNLIGKRVEPALEELDPFLDQALLSGRQEVRIIHGHGTGRLRQAVREHLRAHPGVAQHRAGKANEGGNGATVVTLHV